MKQLEFHFEFQTEEALTEEMLGRLHRDKQSPYSQGKAYWETVKANRHRLVVSPAEQFLPKHPTDRMKASDIAFLEGVGLWDIWYTEGRTEHVFGLVNDALNHARDVIVDESSTEGHTDFGSEAAWWWQQTGHNSPPPTPKKRPPLY